MLTPQENNIKYAFRHLNNLKRSLTLLSSERGKENPSVNTMNMHELHSLQSVMQLELSLRAIQSENRKDEDEDAN